MKSVLVICFNNLKNDARVTRQLNFLKEDFHVTVACYDAHPDPLYEIFRLKKTNLTFFRKALTSVFLLSGLHMIAYWILYDYRKYVRELQTRKFDLIVANDIEAIPFAFEIASGYSKIFFDAHEYAPRQFEDRLYWRIFFRRFNVYLCRKYIPKVDGMSVINDGMAIAYKKEFGVDSIVITNASPYVDMNVLESKNYPIRLVHHGIFTLSRQPDIMVEMMALLDERFTLDLIYLVPDSSSPGTIDFFNKFKARATANPRIRVHPALKGPEIIPFIHKHYDMGIILVPPVNFNYENGLPNKLFDCIQARLGMAVGPLREIARVVSDNGIGVVSGEFTAASMAEALRALTISDVARFKLNADSAARKLNAEVNRKIFLETIRKILS